LKPFFWLAANPAIFQVANLRVFVTLCGNSIFMGKTLLVGWSERLDAEAADTLGFLVALGVSSSEGTGDALRFDVDADLLGGILIVTDSLSIWDERETRGAKVIIFLRHVV
jgi:hypothetical protein